MTKNLIRHKEAIDELNWDMVKVGQLVKCHHDDNYHIVLKTFSQLVSLDEPNHTWTPHLMGPRIVEIFPMGTSVTYIS